MTSVQLPQVMNAFMFKLDPSEQSSTRSIPKLNSKHCAFALHQSILDGRLKQLNYFLKLGLKPDSRDKFGRTCLMLACLSDHQEYGLQVAKLLLRKGADINQQDTMGRTALFLACIEKREKLFNYFLDTYAPIIDFRLKDTDGNILLNQVAVHGNLSMLKKLLDKMSYRHIEIDQRNNSGYTALLLAIKNDKFLNAYLLIKEAQALTSLKDNEKCFNAVEWLLYRIDQNKETTLNDSFSTHSSLENLAFRTNSITKKRQEFLVAKSANLNHKSWYNTNNNPYFQDKSNLALNRSRYIPLILSQKHLENERKSSQISRFLKANSLTIKTSTSSSDNYEELDENTPPKEVAQKLYELIFDKMSLSCNLKSIQPVKEPASTPEEIKQPKASLAKARQSRSQSIKPNIRDEKNKTPLAIVNESKLESKSVEKFKKDTNIFDLESMRHTPKLLALQAEKRTRTVKEVVHSIFDMYDTPMGKAESTTSSAYSRKYSAVAEDLAKSYQHSKSKSIISLKEKSSLFKERNSLSQSAKFIMVNSNHVKFSD